MCWVHFVFVLFLSSFGSSNETNWLTKRTGTNGCASDARNASVSLQGILYITGNKCENCYACKIVKLKLAVLPNFYRFTDKFKKYLPIKISLPNPLSNRGLQGSLRTGERGDLFGDESDQELPEGATPGEARRRRVSQQGVEKRTSELFPLLTL